MITYMKIKHHSLFRGLKSDNIDWSLIRNDPFEKQYFIPSDKSSYIQEVQNNISFKLMVNEILIFIKKLKIKAIFSLGSGRAFLEYKLKQHKLKVSISDSDSSIDIIKSFNIFDNVYKLSFDEVISKLENPQELILLSRIDTEINDEELIKLFQNLAHKKIKYIFFIPAQLLNFKSLFFEIYIRLKSIIYRKKLIFCGYSRSEKLFSIFWKNRYRIIHRSKSKSFLLKLI